MGQNFIRLSANVANAKVKEGRTDGVAKLRTISWKLTKIHHIPKTQNKEIMNNCDYLQIAHDMESDRSYLRWGVYVVNNKIGARSLLLSTI